MVKQEIVDAHDRLVQRVGQEQDDILGTLQLVRGDDLLEARLFEQLVDLLVEGLFLDLRQRYLEGAVEREEYVEELAAWPTSAATPGCCPSPAATADADPPRVTSTPRPRARAGTCARPGEVSRSMRLYVEVARRTYARTSTYRRATVAGVFTNTVFGFLLAYVLPGRVRRSGPLVGAFDVTDAVTFTFVAQGLLMPLGLFSTTEIADRITTGDVIVDLQRPVRPPGLVGGGRVRQGRLLPRSSAASRRSSPARIVFDLRLPVGRRPSPPSSCAVGLAIGDLVRLALPAAAHRVLAPRRPRPEPARAAHRPLPLRRLRPDRVLPGVARDACAASCRSPGCSRCRSRCGSGEHHGHRPARWCTPSRLAWLVALVALGTARAGPGRPPGGGAGWLRPSSQLRRLAPPGRRQDPRRAGSTARRSCCSCSARRW